MKDATSTVDTQSYHTEHATLYTGQKEERATTSDGDAKDINAQHSHATLRKSRQIKKKNPILIQVASP
jgi:hypothetical protein